MKITAPALSVFKITKRDAEAWLFRAVQCRRRCVAFVVALLKESRAAIFAVHFPTECNLNSVIFVLKRYMKHVFRHADPDPSEDICT